MSATTSSSEWIRPRRKTYAPFPSQELVVASLASPLPAGTLPLVPCPSCRVHRTIHLVSQSSSNPGHVFYKFPNHRVTPNPCNHYYWENGEDNYVYFLARNGYYAGETEKEEEDVGQRDMVAILKKMDQLVVIGNKVLAAIICLIVVMVYVEVAK